MGKRSSKRSDRLWQALPDSLILDKCRSEFTNVNAGCRIIGDDAFVHSRTGEDNGDAHLKRQIMGREVVMAITNGRLDFGPWEQIFYGEFDGRRRKRVLVKIIGE